MKCKSCLVETSGPFYYRGTEMIGCSLCSPRPSSKVPTLPPAFAGECPTCESYKVVLRATLNELVTVRENLDATHVRSTKLLNALRALVLAAELDEDIGPGLAAAKAVLHEPFGVS